MRLLLGQIMTRIDHAMLVRSYKHRGVGRGPAWLERVHCTVDRHRRYLNDGLLRQAVFEWLQLRITCFSTKDMAVGVDDDIYEVGIVERRRGTIEYRFSEVPARGPPPTVSGTAPGDTRPGIRARVRSGKDADTSRRAPAMAWRDGARRSHR